MDGYSVDINSEVLLKIFSNPDMVAMLKMLAKTLG